MKKSGNLNGDFEYVLLDENQQDVDLREKILGLYSTNSADILWLELRDNSLVNNGYYKLFYYEQSVLKHIILFKYAAEAQKKINVLNDGYRICNKHIETISYILFSEFSKVQQIIFKGIFVNNPDPSPKMIIEKVTEDVIISDLPKSMDIYIKSLGAKFRKKIKYVTNYIARDFSGFKIHFYEKNDILFEDVQNLFILNRNRMKAKGIIPGLDDADCEILHQYVTTSGFGVLCACKIDDKIIGGMISSIIGQHAYGHVISHNNFYNKYSVGLIVAINLIKYLIEEKKNVKYLHLLGGTIDYKVRLGGIVHDVYTFRIFRNNGIFYFRGKFLKAVKVSYKRFKQKLIRNKMINSSHIKLNKIRMRMQSI